MNEKTRELLVEVREYMCELYTSDEEWPISREKDIADRCTTLLNGD